MAKTIRIGSLIPDTKNANLHSERGSAAVRNSLQKNGVGRSILLDKDNNIIAGNLTTEEAGQIGIEDVIIVETDGTKLVAVKRTDVSINSKRGRELAISDNRSAELSLNWNAPVLHELEELGLLDLKDYFTVQELGGLVDTDYSDKNKELSAEDFAGSKVKLEFQLTFEEHEAVIARLQSYDANKENALLKALGVND